MAKVDFNIQLLDGEPSTTPPLYHPGDMLKGQVVIFTDDDVKCKNIHARLLWRTEGRGTRFEETITETSLFQGTLQAGLPSSYEFSFGLPPDPWSHEGYYVSVVWMVQIDIDVPWGRDVMENKPFLLRPRLTSDD